MQFYFSISVFTFIFSGCMCVLGMMIAALSDDISNGVRVYLFFYPLTFAGAVATLIFGAPHLVEIFLKAS